MAERGGVLLRFAGGADGSLLGFVPAHTAARLAALGSMVPLHAAAPMVAGVALADGLVVTVLRVGEGEPDGDATGHEQPLPGARRALLCRVGALDVALVGGVVVATGLFEAAPVGDGILWRGQAVPALDVRALYAQAEAATWAQRAGFGRAAPPPDARRGATPAGAESDVAGRRETWLPSAPWSPDQPTREEIG